MHIDEVERRFSNARIAALGAAGLSILNCYRVSQEVGYVANSVNIFSVSGIFGVVAGIAWFFMPKADSNTLEETKAETKTILREPINVLINRILHEQKVQLQDLKNKHSPSTSTYRSNRSTGWVRPSSVTVNKTSTTSSSSAVEPTVVRPSTFQDPWDKPFARGKDIVFDDDDLDDDDDDDYTVEDMIKESILDEELDDYWDSLDSLDKESAADY